MAHRVEPTISFKITSSMPLPITLYIVVRRALFSILESLGVDKFYSGGVRATRPRFC